jgi:hypothetical protein
MIRDLMRTRAVRFAFLAALFFVADSVALGGRITYRSYDLILGYSQSQTEISGLKLRAYGAVWSRLLGVEDVGDGTKAAERPVG